MTDKNSGFEDLIDRMIENPAYDQMGGIRSSSEDSRFL